MTRPHPTGVLALRHHGNRAPMAGEHRLNGKPQPRLVERPGLLRRLFGARL